jgi:hypothetical protein
MAPGPPPSDRTWAQAPGRHWWSVGYEFGGTTAVAPGLTLTQRLFLEAGLRRPEWLAPAVRLSVAMLAPPSRGISTQVTETEVLETRVKWTTGRLEGSVLLLQTPDRVTIRPAVYFEAGSYQGELVEPPGDITPRADMEHLWLATGVAGHASVRVVGPLVAELSAGAFVSFFGNDYRIKDDDPTGDTVIHDVPPIGVFISAAIGLTTP